MKPTHNIIKIILICVSYHFPIAVSQEASVVIARRFLVFINPMAGPQRGVADFKQYVKPMLDVAEINYVVEVTSKSS